MDIVFRFVDLIVNPAIFVFFALALILFIWGLYRTWIVSGDGYEQRRQGAWHLLAGLIGMLIMASVFAIMNFVKTSIDDVTGTKDGPELNTIPAK